MFLCTLVGIKEKFKEPQYETGEKYKQRYLLIIP